MAALQATDTPLRSFGRRNGRLRRNPQRLLDEVLPQISLNAAALTLPTGFQRIAMEIGFGAGEHIAAQAVHNPDTLYIGCEPYMPGVAKLLRVIEKENITNIRLFTDDARELMAAMPESSVQQAFVLFPDPWPKSRHHKRRLVTKSFLSALSRMQPEHGYLLLATDHEGYAAWILNRLHKAPQYQWTAEREADWLTIPSIWAETKYQRKTSAEGRAPLFFHCEHKKT